MDASRLNCWTAVISGSSRTSVVELGGLIDFANPPDFFAFISDAWANRKEGLNRPWEVILESQVILRALVQPTTITRQEALTLAQYAMESDALFDTKLLRHLMDEHAWPDEVPADRIMRTLEVLESLDGVRRLAMTLLQFARHPDCRIQSKVAKILGRCVDSLEVMEDLFQNPDGRVRANLIEGLLRRKSLDQFLPLIERASRDQHPRVSSLALAIRAREGHGGASALVKLRSNSKMAEIRKSAEFARRIAAGENTGHDATAGPSLSVAVVDSQPAVEAAIREVHSHTDGHPPE